MNLFEDFDNLFRWVSLDIFECLLVREFNRLDQACLRGLFYDLDQALLGHLLIPSDAFNAICSWEFDHPVVVRISTSSVRPSPPNDCIIQRVVRQPPDLWAGLSNLPAHSGYLPNRPHSICYPISGGMDSTILACASPVCLNALQYTTSVQLP